MDNCSDDNRSDVVQIQRCNRARTTNLWLDDGLRIPDLTELVFDTGLDEVVQHAGRKVILLDHYPNLLTF